MYKYLLFDFDGTLIDTNEIIKYCLNQVSLKYLGKPLTKEDYNNILGLVITEQMKYLSLNNFDEMRNYYRELYKSLQDEMSVEFPEIHEMLVTLKSLGCKMAIVSSKGKNGILHGIEMFKMTDLFDAIVGAYDVNNPKPHPEPALKALELLTGSTEESLFIGDSPYDIKCGKHAGIKTVLVDWTIFDSEKFIDSPPDYRIFSPKDLISIVTKKKEG